MKQVLQHLGTGQTTVVDVPSPSAAPGSLLIRTSASLISAGTERMLVEFFPRGVDTIKELYTRLGDLA